MDKVLPYTKQVTVIGPVLMPLFGRNKKGETPILKGEGLLLKSGSILKEENTGGKLIKYRFKGRDYLLEEYRGLSERNPDWGITIVKGGTVKSRRELKDYIRKELGMRKRED